MWRGGFYQQAGEAQALGWLQIEMSVPVHDSADGVKIFYRSRRRGEKSVASYLAGTLLMEGEWLLPCRRKGCTKAGGLGLRGGLSCDFSAQGQLSASSKLFGDLP